MPAVFAYGKGVNRYISSRHQNWLIGSLSLTYIHKANNLPLPLGDEQRGALIGDGFIHEFRAHGRTSGFAKDVRERFKMQGMNLREDGAQSSIIGLVRFANDELHRGVSF
jgi:hypothetical protein